jgi:hypothetical protein
LPKEVWKNLKNFSKQVKIKFDSDRAFLKDRCYKNT